MQLNGTYTHCNYTISGVRLAHNFRWQRLTSKSIKLTFLQLKLLKTWYWEQPHFISSCTNLFEVGVRHVFRKLKTLYITHRRTPLLNSTQSSLLYFDFLCVFNFWLLKLFYIYFECLRCFNYIFMNYIIFIKFCQKKNASNYIFNYMFSLFGKIFP